MKDPQTLEQQLAALQPAPSKTDVATAMYRCGFAAGQASRAAAPRASHQRWLQWVAAACLTAILGGPVAYRMGQSASTPAVVQHGPAPTAPVIDVPPLDSAGIAVTPPSVPSAEPLVHAPDISVPAKSTAPRFASWLIGIASPQATLSEAAPGHNLVLTSRPPSDDTMAWLARSRPLAARYPDHQPEMLDAPPEEATQDRSSEPNPYRLPPLPSRQSLHTWEPWI